VFLIKTYIINSTVTAIHIMMAIQVEVLGLLQDEDTVCIVVLKIREM